MTVRTAAVLGAGAIGSYVIWGLREKMGDNVWVIAEGSRGERLKKDGLVIGDEAISLQVRTPAEAHGADILFVCLKYGALEGCLPEIRTICDAHTIVVSLMNGIDSEEVIARVIPEAQVLPAIIRISSQRDGNSIHFYVPKKHGGIVFGEPGKDKDTERVRAVRELFDGTKIAYIASDDILWEIWSKFAMNIARNLPQAMLGVSAGAYADSDYAGEICELLRDEVVAVAAAKGIDISRKEGEGKEKDLKVPPTDRYSTLQDLDAKRHTEIDMFSGALIRMGKELGIPTPYNELTYLMIKTLEEKNEGKFEYEASR